jgi:hypothetical protein
MIDEDDESSSTLFVFTELTAAVIQERLLQKGLPLPAGLPLRDAHEDATEDETGDFDHTHREGEFPHISEDFSLAADLTELTPLIHQLNAAEIHAPFVIERTVFGPSMNHPKLGVSESQAMVPGDVFHRTGASERIRIGSSHQLEATCQPSPSCIANRECGWY